jgi:hypothetical protein
MTGVAVREVPVGASTAPTRADYDYADAFECTLAAPDGRTAADWMHAGLEEAPRALRALIVFAHTKVLGLRLSAPDAPGHVLGWEVAHADDHVITLVAASSSIHAVLVGERTGSASCRLTTYLTFDRPRVARPLWALVGPLHRRIAPYLLRMAGERIAAGRG